LRVLEPGTVTIALDETTTPADIADLWAVFNHGDAPSFAFDDVAAAVDVRFDERFRRLWRYYLMYCEGGFRGGGIDVVQFTLRKPA